VNSRDKKLLIIWQFKDGWLNFGTYGRQGYSQYRQKVILLDQEFLPLINKFIYKGNLSAIAVVPNQIHGFSSSRLIFISLNLIAWINNVPIEVIPSSAWENSAVRDTLCAQILAKNKRFTGQVKAQYQYPADITPSKKKKRFAITK
jgi:hypothetical protein